MKKKCTYITYLVERGLLRTSKNRFKPILASIMLMKDFLFKCAEDSLTLTLTLSAEPSGRRGSTNAMKHVPRKKQEDICVVAGVPADSLINVQKSTTKKLVGSSRICHGSLREKKRKKYRKGSVRRKKDRIGSDRIRKDRKGCDRIRRIRIGPLRRYDKLSRDGVDVNSSLARQYSTVQYSKSQHNTTQHTTYLSRSNIATANYDTE